ncbi:TonB dependent receptor [Stenotrophomonas sp. Y6]|uniref:TonB-dependent receptor n=1 Tax=Stenotrophomonas sp. Y6 TaxID=2920383 RepID=UPI001F05EA3C|nr:TonB-dependent receptor [Stenotrophomonas sp. Y6]MCH1909595.1 TonB dependent receptor [Stenotrophomonas sp. Y6]
MVKRKTIQRAALSAALSLCIAGGAYAQSNASGSIFGAGGQPGATVTIRNVETGLTREIRVDNNGRYSASALPVGKYEVILKKDGEVVASKSDVLVQLGAGSEVSFAAAGGSATDMDRIEVRASAMSPIDVSATDSRQVFTAEQISKMSIGRNINALAMLAPGVVAADSRYGNVSSFSGSAASENAFYINGYAVTNPLTNLGSTTLPFDAIGQYQVITGGYGSEFGRATGGVVNIITKSGTNDFKAGAQLVWTPKDFRAHSRNIYYPSTGKLPNTDGLIYQHLSDQTTDSLTYGAYASGPIIKDRLFFYAGAEFEDQDRTTVSTRSNTGTGYQKRNYEVPRWLVKLDWYINDNHLLEFTGISDVTKQTMSAYAYNYTGSNVFNPGNVKNSGYYYEDGGELYIGKYTGYLTDSLTLTALYGEQEQDHIAKPWGYDPSVVYVSDSRNVSNPVRFGAFDQLSFPDAYDKTDGYRIDLEWRLGNHTLRGGYDVQNSESRAGEVTSGPGYRWIYNSVGAANANETIPGSGGARGPGGNGDYVVKYVYANGGTFKVEQKAFYLEDRWQVTDNWLLSLGLRNESFQNFNADGIVYVEQKNQWAPRIGATWDVFGDSSLKVFANAGRYHLAMPNNVALRGAAGSTYTMEYFSFTGIDPNTGAPLGTTALGNGPFSSNNEYGQAPDPASVAAKGLKSHYQDEFVLGFEKQLGESLTFGARYMFRDLKSAIDDMCDWRPAYYWAIENGYSESVAEALGDGLGGCRLFNPGVGNTFQLDDGTGNLITVPLSAQQLGFPKLKRRYQGIGLFLEHSFDGKFYGKIDYTWSHNYGNAEGQLKSDVAQGDVSQTMDWDHPEMMFHANGNLPNDRRHYLKSFGYYQLNDEWRFSSTFTLMSGRPKNCTGIYAGPDPDGEFSETVEYSGPYYRYCNGKVMPRGSAGTTPWVGRLDMGVAYRPSFLNNKLELSLDVFNVTNSQTAQNYIEYGEIGSVGNPYHSTNRVISYSTPRYMRLGLRYDF